MSAVQLGLCIPTRLKQASRWCRVLLQAVLLLALFVTFADE